jgi:hypothetical protein
MGKISFIPNFNKSSQWAHMELELDVLGVYGKLVKYLVHISKKNLKINLHRSCPNSIRPVFGLNEF